MPEHLNSHWRRAGAGRLCGRVRARLIRTFTSFKRGRANSSFTPFKRRSNGVQTRIQGHFRPFGPKRLALACRLRRSNVVQTTQTNVWINLACERPQRQAVKLYPSRFLKRRENMHSATCVRLRARAARAPAGARRRACRASHRWRERERAAAGAEWRVGGRAPR
jgi:hypothetical protein